MADNKKYYYLKLKDNFFDSDAMILLESMEDGYLYSNILLKLYLRSLKDEGKLMFNDRIPYNPNMIAKITRHNVGVIEKALKIFHELGLIEVLDNGAIYMLDIQNFIGESSTEADRIRAYRKRIDNEKTELLGGCTNVQEDAYKCTPEIEIEKELDIEKDIEVEKKKKKPKKKTPPGYDPDEKLNQAILDFIGFRKKIRASMTDRAITLMLNKLNKMTDDNDEKIEILEQSIMNGWKSVYPLKKDDKRKGGKQTFDDFVEVGKEWLNDTAGVFDDSSND